MGPLRKITAVAWVSLALLTPCALADEWDDARATAAAIDRIIGQAQQEAGLTPSPLADDAAFARRLSLDLTGRVPSSSLAADFIASADPRKREQLIAQIMESEQCREGMSLLWTLWLLGRNPTERQVNRFEFRKWVEQDVIAADMPQDQFARELITATGRNDEVGSTNYLLQFRNAPEDATGMISRQFLGRQIQCAQCHDHKTEPFTQRQFWSMAAFLTQTRGRPIRGEDGKPVAAELVDAPRPRPTRIPDTDPPVTVVPTYLDGAVFEPRRGVNLRRELAAKITDPSSDDLARATVNRLWFHFTGQGFVEPIDDFRASNPIELPQLLDHLAQDFKSHGYDRDHLVRSVVLSQTYQRSSEATAGNAGDERLYTHARLRPLTPEQLFWSMVTVTGANPANERMGPRRDRNTGRDLTPDQRVERMVNQFVFNFSDDDMDESTMFEGTIPLSLFMMNSPQINNAFNPRAGATMAALMREQDVAERIDGLYLAALGRPPSADERASAASYLSRPLTGTNRLGLTQDLMWALLNSSEFMLNR